MPNAGYQLEFAACTNDLTAATEVAGKLGGTRYIDAREKYDHLPFRALVTCTTDDLADLEPITDRGLYVVCRRVIKPGTPKVVGLFTMVHRQDKSHQACDAHWREQHAPLALVHHIHMTHYSQLSVVQRLSGPDYHGFALCGFASEDDVRNRFYTTKESVPIIAKDVGQFADPKGSPPRLIATVT